MSRPRERKENFFVLAGSAGTGKTTVLAQLRQKGFFCADEAARAVLEEQLAIQGPALPSNNPLLFVQTMQSQNVKSFEEAREIREPVFFDRAMPDLVHYAIRFGIDPQEFETASKKHLYSQTVFLFSPWREIFVNDNVRKMSFEKSVEFHELLVGVYKKLGYNLVEVPFGSIETRAEFILGIVGRETTKNA